MTMFERLSEIAQCLCDQVSNSSLPDLCFCGVMPGAVVAYDYIDAGCNDSDGMAWVRLVSQYPSTNFPNPQTVSTNCDTSTALQVEMGLIRSVIVDTDLEGLPIPPDAAYMSAVAEQQLDEMELMRAALTCCVSDRVVLLNYEPIGPEGQAVGGKWTTFVTPEGED